MYYQNSERNPEQCACGGSGWVLDDRDFYAQCSLHSGTPHPEDVDGCESFDYDAHYTKVLRNAWESFRETYERAGGTKFRAQVEKYIGVGGREPQDWVNAAEEVALTAGHARRESEAVARGYSCALEEDLEWEAHRERAHA